MRSTSRHSGYVLYLRYFILESNIDSSILKLMVCLKVLTKNFNMYVEMSSPDSSFPILHNIMVSEEKVRH